MGGHPGQRPRRLRRTPALRSAFAEVRLHPSDFVLPLFVKEGIEAPEPVGSMPGVMQHSHESVLGAVREAVGVGVASFILFGIPSAKDATGSGSWDRSGPVPRALEAIREQEGDGVVLWGDVCACEYTDHGHCGPVVDETVDNDAAVAGYVRAAVVYADAGADLVAPSGMMDGQVGAIRSGLDSAGRAEVGIVAYAAKYASAFYGPFRDAAESSMAFGDRSGYQMDPANRTEATREVRLDLEQGADAVMVKPALAYLDVIADVARTFDAPVAAYHVSGEYAMVKAAAANGWLDGDRAMAESVLSIRRAGASSILTYAAVELSRMLG